MGLGSAKLSCSRDLEEKHVHITCCPTALYSFFNLDKLLVLLSTEDSTQDKVALIPLFTFAHPLISKHYTEGKELRGQRKTPLASQFTAECDLLQAAHQLSAHHALNGHVRRHSWLGPRSNLTQLCRSYPNQKLVESNQQQMLSNSDLAQIFWQPLQCSSLIYF